MLLNTVQLPYIFQGVTELPKKIPSKQNVAQKRCSKTYQKVISKPPRCFVFQKRISFPSKLHQKINQNKLNILPIEIMLKEVCQNNVDFSPIKIRSSRRLFFHSSKLCLTKYFETTSTFR